MPDKYCFVSDDNRNNGMCWKNAASFNRSQLVLCVLMRPNTLVKFSKISPTRAGSYCQQTSYRKWAVLCKMQKFQFFTTSPLEMRACGTGIKFAEYAKLYERIIKCTFING
jgi:hypothetical protein